MSILELKNVTEHKCCPNFTKNDSDKPILVCKLLKSESMSTQLKNQVTVNRLLYVVEGELNVIIRDESHVISTNELFLIPSNEVVNIVGIKKENVFFRLSLANAEYLCHNYSLDILYKEHIDKDDFNYTLFSLKGNEMVIKFFEFISLIYKNGIYCRFYAESKVGELLFLLRAYYDKVDLYKFFYPILTSDLAFSQFIMSNHAKAKTVTELAEIANYSLSGFQKRFKKIFGISAHAWMRKERLKLIYDDISHTSFTLKDLSLKYDFSTPSHFNDYCKANFGYTPGYIRKKKVKIFLDSYTDYKDSRINTLA